MAPSFRRLLAKVRRPGARPQGRPPADFQEAARQEEANLSGLTGYNLKPTKSHIIADVIVAISDAVNDREQLRMLKRHIFPRGRLSDEDLDRWGSEPRPAISSRSFMPFSSNVTPIMTMRHAAVTSSELRTAYIATLVDGLVPAGWSNVITPSIFNLHAKLAENGELAEVDIAILTAVRAIKSEGLVDARQVRVQIAARTLELLGLM